MSAAFYTIAQEPTKHYTPEQKAAVKNWAVWTGGMILGGMLVIGIVLVIVHRHRKQLLRATQAKRRKTRIGKDAWVEAGKRIDPDAAGARDETVDIDPGEIGPQDVDGDEDGGLGGRDPHGQGPHG